MGKAHWSLWLSLSLPQDFFLSVLFAKRSQHDIQSLFCLRNVKLRPNSSWAENISLPISRSLPSFDFHQDTDLLERNKPLAKSGWNTQDLACKRRWRCKEKGGEAGQRALPKQKIQTDWFVNLLTATYHLQVRMTEHRAYSTLRHGGCGVFQEMKRKDSAGWSPDLHFKELQQFCK